MPKNDFGWCTRSAFLAAIVTLSISAAAEPPDRASTPHVFIGSETFHRDALGDAWLLDDPNDNDALSLTARPGWLQIQIDGPDEDIWLEARGKAPVLLRSLGDADRDFVLETYVDLATSNGGYPILNSMGGLVVCPAGGPTDACPFLLTLGIQHNWEGGTEIILQEPGHSIKWTGPGANAAYLRLVRNAAEGSWSGYFKIHADSPWTLLSRVKDPDLSNKTSVDKISAGKLEVGLVAKTWDSNLGGPAQIDFAYFGNVPQAVLATPSTESAKPKQTSPQTDVTALKSFCVVGKERNVLNAYREAEILRHTGRGCLTHMWFGGDWPGYHLTRIRVYVDGEQQPSIDMELGLGHGYGFGDTAAPWGGTKLGKTGQPSGIYNTYKIPYGNGVRVTAQRSKDSPDGAPFWWIVRGTENLPITLAGARLPKQARLKLHKLVGHVASPLEEFALCDVPDAGALYQVTMAADGQRDTGDWKDISYLEAIMRAYVDGKSQPIRLSSGLEDYFLGTYYFNRGRYANDLAGLTHLDEDDNTFSAYRFHDDDPLFFQQGLRLTCRCGEMLKGAKMHDPPKTKFTTYTWIYQW